MSGWKEARSAEPVLPPHLQPLPFLLQARCGSFSEGALGTPYIRISWDACGNSGSLPSLCIAKCWKLPKCPSVNEWFKKLWYIYTRQYYTAKRKNELLPFETAWVELESIILSEISQMVKDKYVTISPISGT